MNTVTLGRTAPQPHTCRPGGPRGPHLARCLPHAKRRHLPVTRAAGDAFFAPAPPAPPAPRHPTGFFDDVTGRCQQLIQARAVAPESMRWAQRFVVAIKQYLAAYATWEAAGRGDAGAQRFLEARAHALFTLDVARRCFARAPQDIVAALGHLPTSPSDAADALPTLSTWESFGHALRLSQSQLASAGYVPPVTAMQAQTEAMVDGVSLAHLHTLLQRIEKKQIDLPAVVAWHHDVRDALEQYDVAEATLAQRGHGWQGLHLLNTLHSIENLQAVADKLPFSIQTFTDPKATFEASMGWQDAAGSYLRGARALGSKSCRVRDYLQLRVRELRQEAEPYLHSVR